MFKYIKLNETKRIFKSLFIATSFTILSSNLVSAQYCDEGKNFSMWLSEFKSEAIMQGVKPQVVDAVLSGVKYDPSIIQKDRAQAVFAQDFVTFAGRMADGYRYTTGRNKIKQNSSLFSRIERQFGVSAAVLTAFWGLETDFGANNGDAKTAQSLATLAYDCRRPDLFRPQLMSLLFLVQVGDVKTNQLKGAWAGELGQVQFLPKDYWDNAVDFDGDGRRDLIGSTADALASSANLLIKHGWRPGEPWIEEVRVPKNLPWKEADLEIKHSRAQWAALGVTRADGRLLPADSVMVSLLLPMGRNGPAFIAYRNFDVYLKWNQSFVYTLTAAYYATRLAGASVVKPGRGKVEPLSLEETKNLQRWLVAQGYDVGKVDGVIGRATRDSVRQVQIRLGLPADGYPDRTFLRSLR